MIAEKTEGIQKPESQESIHEPISDGPNFMAFWLLN